MTIKPRSIRDVLLLIAVAAMLCFAGLELRSWRNSGRHADPDSYVSFHLKCLNCGEEFVRSRGEMPPAARALFVNSTELRVECPKCGQRQGAIMRKCPHCGELYVPIWTRSPQGPEARDICPHCNTDLTVQTKAPELLQPRRTP